MSEQIERLRKEFGATEGKNKSLVLTKEGVVTDMVAYWDAHAGYHRVSDAGASLLAAVKAVVREPKLGLPPKKYG